MKSINIDNIPNEIHQSAKVAAAQQGITLREFIIKAIVLAVRTTPERLKESK
ncbi:MAG TPA: toxin-antitoxin system HicB family antitoxin [Terriglobia bacterium]|nr:toxin-antitoxin system HicB family antitoxin [Terriglobia bacterium]